MMLPYTSRSFLDARSLSALRRSPIGQGVEEGVLVACGVFCGMLDVRVFITLETDGLVEGILGGVCDPSNLEAKLRGREILAYAFKDNV